MPVITVKDLNLFGIKLDSTTPITPRTIGFFATKGVQIRQNAADNTVTLDTGNGTPSFSGEEVQAFLQSKASSKT